MEEHYNHEACKLRHESDERRIINLENILTKIFDKLDRFSQRPSWLTSGIITFLATALGIVVTVLLSGGAR